MSYSPSVAVARGTSAMQYWHNEATKFPSNYGLTFQQLIDKINTDSPNLLNAFGSNIFDGQITEAEIQTNMVSIADQGQGMLPSLYSEFVNWTVGATIDNLSFVNSVESGVSQTVGQVAAAGSQVTSAAVSGVTNTLKILPLIAAAAILLFVWVEAKQV